ncbi:MAG: 2-amino-4-hydroxy-6-hydroxymethyldihydropteridine diphosphokinase FolK [Porphyrobacter sp. HL-46]|nr:MAG: 2-amino-4-hydroxy-6-hydroxymethyldihydropteridine diphosphokinase FolK [Porphyrobacter sp. HL-46]
MSSLYLIALGSNRRHAFYGAPGAVVRAAQEEVSAFGTVLARSPVTATAPIGAARRRFANAALVLETELAPSALLAACKRTEREFGRRRGQRWGDRVLDLDIVLWSGGIWRSGGPCSGLAIPHSAFRTRGFVLGPARAIAPDWRDPVSGITITQLHARLTRPRPLPR